MKVSISVRLLKREIPRRVWGRLASFCPSGTCQHAFSLKSAEGDLIVTQVLAALREGGLSPWNGAGDRKPEEYWLQRERHYTEADFKKSPLLQPLPKACLRDVCLRDEQGRLELHSDYWDAPPRIVK